MEQAQPGPPPLPSQQENASGANRRTAERVSVATEVGVYSDSNFYTGFTEDVSEGGLFVATYDLQPIGTRIELEFGLPGGAEFKLVGVVRWLRDPIMAEDGMFPGMGVQFVELTEEDKALISEFVGTREPLFYDE